MVALNDQSDFYSQVASSLSSLIGSSRRREPVALCSQLLAPLLARHLGITGTGAGVGLRPGQMGYLVGSLVYWRPDGAVRRKAPGVICSTFQPGCCLSR